jgi:hypothetical protein
LGELKVANASLDDDTRTPAIKVATTNIKPVSVAAAEPMRTEKLCQVVRNDTPASCMMDPPFDVLAHVRRLIRLLSSRGGGRMGPVASQSNTRRWEGSLCVSEEDMSSLFILSHLSAARKRMSQL